MPGLVYWFIAKGFLLFLLILYGLSSKNIGESIWAKGIWICNFDIELFVRVFADYIVDIIFQGLLIVILIDRWFLISLEFQTLT